MSEAKPGEPTLSKKEIRRLTDPFLRKDLDLQQLIVLCNESSSLFQATKNSPEFAAVFAERLGITKLVVDGQIKAPLDRDPRNIFEGLAYDNESQAYQPGSNDLLLKIIANGLPRAEAEVVINSIFSPNCRGTYPNLNMSLEINTSPLKSSSTPDWVKQMACFQDYIKV